MAGLARQDETQKSIYHICQYNMISNYELQRLQRLIDTDRTDSFYHWTKWERLREDVLRLDNYECQRCKTRGRYRRAVVVHHVKHVKDRPDLALSLYDPDTHERQLVSLCKACHEEAHPERIERWKYKAVKKRLTEERWD